MLHRNTIQLVDLKSANQLPQLPRVNLDVWSLTMLGSICCNRFLLEIEQRFMWNTSELPFEDPGEIDINDRQLISMLLDLRIFNYLVQAYIYKKAIKLLLK